MYSKIDYLCFFFVQVFTKASLLLLSFLFMSAESV